MPEVWVINARHMRNLPGRKTDVADAMSSAICATGFSRKRASSTAR